MEDICTSSLASMNPIQLVLRLGVLMALLQCTFSEDPFVMTFLGRVNGARCNGVNGDEDVASYLGIPFALPPVGIRRWASPVKYTSRYPTAGMSAKAPGPSCRQGYEVGGR